jgi:hypothetical protein
MEGVRGSNPLSSTKKFLQIRSGISSLADGRRPARGAIVGAKLLASGMAGASRRGYGEDGIYFDHRGDCRDAHHKTRSGRWRGVVLLGYAAGGKRIRRKARARPGPRSRTSSRTCTPSWTLACGLSRVTRWTWPWPRSPRSGTGTATAAPITEEAGRGEDAQGSAPVPQAADQRRHLRPPAGRCPASRGSLRHGPGRATGERLCIQRGRLTPRTPALRASHSRA